MGGFIAVCVGLGPGLFFNPILIQLGMNPAVASGTGMYMTFYTTLAATIIVIFFKKIYL